MNHLIQFRTKEEQVADDLPEGIIAGRFPRGTVELAAIPALARSGSSGVFRRREPAGGPLTVRMIAVAGKQFEGLGGY
jgi:hypothetical protein